MVKKLDPVEEAVLTRVTQQTPELRELDLDEGEDNAIYAAFRFAPAFELKLFGPDGSASFVIHFCTNSEGDNDMDADWMRTLLRRALDCAVIVS